MMVDCRLNLEVIIKNLIDLFMFEMVLEFRSWYIVGMVFFIRVWK